jgi:hypothetical protein
MKKGPILGPMLKGRSRPASVQGRGETQNEPAPW